MTNVDPRGGGAKRPPGLLDVLASAAPGTCENERMSASRATEQNPRRVYHERRAARRREHAAAERRHHAIGTVRLVLVGIAAALGIGIVGGAGYSAWWILAPLAGVVWLGFRLDRIETERSRLERASAFYDRGLARLDDAWAGTGERGDEFADPKHLYAADLDLFGDGYRTARGEELPGVGLFDVTTVAPPPGAERCVGDVLAETDLDGIGEVVGFENHAGRTYLGPGARPFARVHNGWGNNGVDGTEGAVAGSALGTYLHGSLLPRNPRVTDWLIATALRHRYGLDASIADAPPEGAYAVGAREAAANAARERGRPATD